MKIKKNNITENRIKELEGKLNSLESRFKEVAEKLDYLWAVSPNNNN